MHPMNTNICARTNLALKLNYIIAHHSADLTLDEVRDAARNHRLVRLLHHSITPPPHHSSPPRTH